MLVHAVLGHRYGDGPDDCPDPTTSNQGPIDAVPLRQQVEILRGGRGLPPAVVAQITDRGVPDRRGSHRAASALCPPTVARLGEVLDALGRKSNAPVGPAGWNAALAKGLGTVLALIGIEYFVLCVLPECHRTGLASWTLPGHRRVRGGHSGSRLQTTGSPQAGPNPQTDR